MAAGQAERYCVGLGGSNLHQKGVQIIIRYCITGRTVIDFGGPGHHGEVNRARGQIPKIVGWAEEGQKKVKIGLHQGQGTNRDPSYLMVIDHHLVRRRAVYILFIFDNRVIISL